MCLIWITVIMNSRYIFAWSMRSIHKRSPTRACVRNYIINIILIHQSWASVRLPWLLRVTRNQRGKSMIKGWNSGSTRIYCSLKILWLIWIINVSKAGFQFFSPDKQFKANVLSMETSNQKETTKWLLKHSQA